MNEASVKTVSDNKVNIDKASLDKANVNKTSMDKASLDKASINKTSRIDIDTSTTRFTFGKNWTSFLKLLNEARIAEAEKSLQDYLGFSTLAGKSFLDVGSGSGLFSLAAHRLGARVTSFDYDTDSVACTLSLKEKFSKTKADTWQVFQGSILDTTLVQKLGTFDIVYAWGVLHHTGNMFGAFAQVDALVHPGGLLFISIYNDQGGPSRRWSWVKKHYNEGNRFTKILLIIYTIIRLWTLTFISELIQWFKKPFQGNRLLKTWKNYGEKNRGMSAFHDLIDWVGGYPFEVAKPEVVFDFFKEKGFQLLYLKTCAGGIGCNQFVFKKNKP